MHLPEDNWKKVRERINEACRRAGRPPESVRLVAVSKNHPAEAVLAVARLGQREFGENYVQEWRAKQAQLERLAGPDRPAIRWHFIGHLQSNKAKEVAGEVAVVETVDSSSLAAKIDRFAAEKGRCQEALLEIRLETEAGKSGWLPEDLRRALPALAELKHVAFRGLMAVPPPPERPEDSRPRFRNLKSLLDEINQMGVFSQPLTELSMGMSQDFEIAIEEGATMVRIGTAIFGPRS